MSFEESWLSRDPEIDHKQLLFLFTNVEIEYSPLTVDGFLQHRLYQNDGESNCPVFVWDIILPPNQHVSFLEVCKN